MIRSFPPHPNPLPCLRRSGFAQAGPRGEGRPFIPPAELGGILAYFDKLIDRHSPAFCLCKSGNSFVVTPKRSDVYFLKVFIDCINQPIFVVHTATVYFLLEIFQPFRLTSSNPWIIHQLSNKIKTFGITAFIVPSEPVQIILCLLNYSYSIHL